MKVRIHEDSQARKSRREELMDKLSSLISDIRLWHFEIYGRIDQLPKSDKIEMYLSNRDIGFDKLAGIFDLSNNSLEEIFADTEVEIFPTHKPNLTPKDAFRMLDDDFYYLRVGIEFNERDGGSLGPLFVQFRKAGEEPGEVYIDYSDLDIDSDEVKAFEQTFIAGLNVPAIEIFRLLCELGMKQKK